MRGQEETFGMGAGASVRKGKTAKQVRRARKALDAKKSASTKPKVSMSSKPDAVDRAGYRAPKATPKSSRRSADSYGSPTKKRQGELGGLSPVLKFVTRGAAKGFKNIQNKGPGTSAYKAKNKK